jgi:transcriptional repressor NrdR
MDSTDIESTVIGDLVIKELKKLDKVAYIRFASVYREFEDIGEFAKEVKSLKS